MNNEDIIEINQYEKRVIQYKLFSDNAVYNPDSVNVKIYNESNTAVFDQSGVIYNNKISFILPTSITETYGKYIIYWKITKDNEIYYKKTRIHINQLW